MTFTITHSPDADDRFMFWALQTGQLASPEPIRFAEADTQRLNELAKERSSEVLAISAAAYPSVAQWYQPLGMGCSIGDGYGPVVVAKKPMDRSALQGARIAIPGLQTTAYRVLRSLVGPFRPQVVPIVPMAGVFEALARDEVDAALIIHEGRLIYDAYDTVKVCDLGEWWMAETDTPLPLGMNVIARSIPEDRRRAWAALFVDSFRHGLAHREAFIADYSQRSPMDVEALRQYLTMYANESTLSPSQRDRAGFQALYARLTDEGVIAGTPPMDWL